MAACAELLRPLYDILVSLVLQSRSLHTDDTAIKNLGHAPDATDRARFWVYLGDKQHPYNVFDFTLNRRRDGPAHFLKNYRGYLHADAFSGYDGLYLPKPGGGGAIVEVACNAHARRKFHDARTSDAARAHQALAYYAQLYELERRAKDNQLDDDARRRLRQELAVPILDRFHAWLERQRADVLPKSPMGEALGYALNHWTALCRYTEAGFLAIDNNAAEREIRPDVLIRKTNGCNRSETGAQTHSILTSIIRTCQKHGQDFVNAVKRVLRHPAPLALDLVGEATR